MDSTGKEFFSCSNGTVGSLVVWGGTTTVLVLVLIFLVSGVISGFFA